MYQTAGLRHFLFLSGRGKLDDPYNPPLHIQIKTDMFSYYDSVHGLRAHNQHTMTASLRPSILDRNAKSRRVNRFDRAAGYRGRCQQFTRLIGPTASMKINTLIMGIANVFLGILLSLITPNGIVS